jgi:type I restriction-modification system DNA methylase subunit
MNKQEAKQQIQKLVEKYQRVVEIGKVKSYNEAQTRNEFIEPLFEFLGWDMRNLTTDNEVTTEENVSGGRVDLAFRFNNIPEMFLEAKAMKVDLDEWKWAEQAINYSWNKSVTWAVLTDFESIKIFNAEIPPKNISQNLFIELNCRDFINRFDQLWLLSKESFEQKLLDKEAEKWGKLTQRKQVGEKLFEDLMSWRVSLTKDFKKQNTLTDEELDEGVQRILDRLIFIRTAEDRKIEPNVLLGISRGGRANSYKQLAKVFRDFDDGFNSKLFAYHYCEEWKASDKIISEVIKGLYETKDGYRYDFSVISADVLGGIYEQYLSFVQGRKGEDKAKSKRKSQGIYYTPKYIVEFIVKETLGEVLKKTKPKEIQKIKVLDPACGSGSFLIAAYDKILEQLTKQNPQTSLFAKFDILKENIFGVDLDVQAVEIAQLNLLLKVLSQKTKLPMLQHNISSGNSLVSGNAEKLEKYFGPDFREQKQFNFEDEFKEVFEQGGFDVIIGNPPYVRQETIKQLKPYFESAFPNSYTGTADLYVYFFERSMSLLKEGGYFGFIVSNKFIRSGYGKNLRKYLKENFTIVNLVDAFDEKVFADASVDPCIIVIKKNKPRKNNSITYNYKIKVPQLSLQENGWTFADASVLGLKEKIEKVGKKIKDWEGVEIYFGIKSGLNRAFIIDEDQKQELIKKDHKSREIIEPLLRGRDVGRYNISFQNLYLIKTKIGVDLKQYPAIWEHLENYKSDLFKRTDYKKDVMEWYHLRPCVYYEEFKKPKIIYPDISDQGRFYWDEEGYFFNNTIYMLSGNIKKSWLAVLNSKLMSWYYRQIASGLGEKGTRYFMQFVKELPIPESTEPLEKDVDLMLDLHKELRATSANTDKYTSLKREIGKLDREIDEAIYKLYELSNEEIRTIEE